MPNYEVIVPFRKCYQITADSPEEAKAWLEEDMEFPDPAYEEHDDPDGWEVSEVGEFHMSLHHYDAMVD